MFQSKGLSGNINPPPTSEPILILSPSTLISALWQVQLECIPVKAMFFPYLKLMLFSSVMLMFDMDYSTQLLWSIVTPPALKSFHYPIINQDCEINNNRIAKSIQNIKQDRIINYFSSLHHNAFQSSNLSDVFNNIKMYADVRDRTRIASLGKKTMDNSLKLFYDQVMNSALNQAPAAVQFERFRNDLSSRRAQMYRETPGPGSLEREQKAQDEISKIMGSLNKSKSKSISKPIETRIEELRSLKSHRDQLSQLAEKIDEKKIEARIIESRMAGSKVTRMTEKVEKVQHPIFTNGFVPKYGYKLNNENQNKPEVLRPKQLSFASSPTVVEQNSHPYLETGYKMKLYSERPISNQLSNINQTFFTQNISKYPKDPPKKQQHLSKKAHFSIAQKQEEQHLDNEMKASHKTFKRTFKQQISFLKPTVTRKQEARRRLKKAMLAVYWLCCQVKIIKNKIKERKSKYNPIFNNLVPNVIEHIRKAYIDMLKPAVDKIKSFTNKQACEQNSKSYLVHFNQILKCIIYSFKALKKLIMEDKYSKNILKLLVKQRQSMPDNYLTPFELSRIEMSRMFGYAIKSQQTCQIFIITFIFIRVILLEILAFPIKLDPDFIMNPIWKKTVNDVRCVLYLSCLELIEEEVEHAKYYHLRGNWAAVSQDMRYKPGQPFYVDVQEPDSRDLVSNNWDTSGAKFFKQKMPNSWELMKDEISQWCGEIYDELKQVQIVEGLGSKSSKRTQKK